MKVLAADIGFGATGLAVLSLRGGQPGLVAFSCVHTAPEHKKRGIYVAHDDVRRAQEITRGIAEAYAANDCRGLICELPSAGAQGAKPNRAMGIATGLIAALAEVLRCPVEWITPGESRAAAIGRQSAPKGENIKHLVMAAMQERYPEIAGLKLADKEHIADALATFEAARGRQMLRVLAAAEGAE